MNAIDAFNWFWLVVLALSAIFSVAASIEVVLFCRNNGVANKWVVAFSVAMIVVISFCLIGIYQNAWQLDLI